MEILNTLQKDEFIELFNSIFFKNRKLVETHIVAEDHIQENNLLKKERLDKNPLTYEALSPEWLKRRLPLYPDYNSML